MDAGGEKLAWREMCTGGGEGYSSDPSRRGKWLRCAS